MGTLNVTAHLSRETILVRAATGEVLRAGRPVALRRREREVVVVLALQSRPISGTALGLILNPDWAEAHAANGAKVYVHRLRRAVAQDFVSCDARGYAFGPRVRVDAAEARSLLERPVAVRETFSAEERERVVSLARGLRCDGAPDGDEREWFETSARRLRRLGRDLAMTTARAALDAGDPHCAVRVARELTYEDACDEEAWEVLIRALLALGERPAAAHGYRTYEAALAEELQATPSAHLRRLLGENAPQGGHYPLAL
jgi:DNA-binding SARP family transcriptional activator